MQVRMRMQMMVMMMMMMMMVVVVVVVMMMMMQRGLEVQYVEQRRRKENSRKERSDFDSKGNKWNQKERNDDSFRGWYRT